MHVFIDFWKLETENSFLHVFNFLHKLSFENNFYFLSILNCQTSFLTLKIKNYFENRKKKKKKAVIEYTPTLSRKFVEKEGQDTGSRRSNTRIWKEEDCPTYTLQVN